MQQLPSGTQYSDMNYAIFLSWPDNFLLELGNVVATNQAKITLLGYNSDVPIVIKGGEQGIGVIFSHLPLNTCTVVDVDRIIATYLCICSYGK